MHLLWEERCSTVDSISNVWACMTNKIQKHSNHTAVVEFGKRLSFDKGELSICSSNIEAKSFQHSFDQIFLYHIKTSSFKIAIDVKS